MKNFILGEFSDSEQMVTALRTLREAGETGLDAYSPYPLHGTSEAIGLPKSRVTKFALGGGLLGACTGYAMQWWMNAVDYPINVGGRPLHSAPSWVPITFELAVLFAAFAIFFGSIGLFGLPRTYHPVFEDDAFRRASINTFWISVELRDDPKRAERLLARLSELGASHVSSVADAASLPEEP